MWRYILRRILVGVPVLLAITIIVFALIEASPGDITAFFVGPEAGAKAADVQKLQESLGLNVPAPVRYVRWLGQLLKGNMGYRMKNGDSVAWIIKLRLGATLTLVGAALLFGTVVGVVLGVIAALKRNTWIDYTLTALSFVGISMPAYIAALLGLYFLSVRFHVFPSGGMWTVGRDATLWDLLYHLVLPAGTLSLAYLASNMRYTRFSMLEVLRENFVTTARSKGLAERVVIYKHALKNALLPVVTLLGLNLPNLAVGALFTESIYSWPGMGSLYLDAIQSRDYPLIMGANLVIAVFVLAANLLTDICYAFIDPRISYD